jgi:hypothetical protein
MYQSSCGSHRTTASPSPRERKEKKKQQKMNSIFTKSSDGEGATQLKEMLQIGACILIGLATKWASLYHRDETGLDLEISGLDVDVKAREHLVSRRG